jgi:hypothetical protein
MKPFGASRKESIYKQILVKQAFTKVTLSPIESTLLFSDPRTEHERAKREQAQHLALR